MRGFKISLMNYSKLKPQIYSYLGYHGVGASEETDALILDCLKELEKVQTFRYRYKAFGEIPAFLLKEPYLEFLKGTSGVVLSVMTLGTEVDRLLKLYARTNAARCVVFDASASAYLEYRSDEYEKTIGGLSYRFCPGYGGSSVGDIRYIFELLQPEKIGMTLLENNYMLPSKSMAGVLGIGGGNTKNCGSCILLAHCNFRMEGTRCYGSEKT